METNRLQKAVNNLVSQAVGSDETYLLGALESISGILQVVGEESQTVAESNNEPIPSIAQLVSSINELLDTEDSTTHKHKSIDLSAKKLNDFDELNELNELEDEFEDV